MPSIDQVGQDPFAFFGIKGVAYPAEKVVIPDVDGCVSLCIIIFLALDITHVGPVVVTNSR